MDLNVQDWKEFTIGRMFRLEPVKGKTTDELVAGSDIPYIAAKHDDNGLDMMCQKSGFEDWISEGNCIVFVQLGEGSSGYVNYIPDDFIGMNGKVSCGYLDDVMNPYVGLFLEVILCQERPKHSFGRSWTGTRLTETVIKLPIQHNPDGTPIVDANKTYSDEGYIPDWQFMEDYIKSLHSEPITTTRGAVESLSLGVDKWEEFKLSDIFEMQNGYFNNKPETIDSLPSDHPVKFLGATAENNGITDYCGIEAIQYSSKTGDSDNSLDGKIYEGNCITITNDGSVCHAYYQDTPFTSSHSQTICVPKFELNPALALFICAIIDGEQFKWSYGRKLHDLNKSKAIVIKLPIQRDISGNPVIDPDKQYSDKGYIPDWDFMERYINSLPYSDKIA